MRNLQNSTLFASGDKFLVPFGEKLTWGKRALRPIIGTDTVLIL